MKERILLVEDNDINLKLLTYVLKPYGYEILTAVSGEEALEMVGKHDPDLILLDIRLPDINGYEVCEQLKSKEETKDIPVIFMTALAQKEHRIKGLEIGAVDFITKPFFQEEVILRVKNHLKLRRVEKKLQETVENQALLLDNIEPMVWYLEDPKTLGKVNNSFAAFFERSKEEMENLSLEAFMLPEELEECLKGNNHVFRTKTKIHHEHIHTNGAGKKRLLAVTKAPKLNSKGEVDYLICSAEDITDRKKKEERINYLTFHDALTGLFNRAFYEEELVRLDVERTLPLSIISCDVNGLKLANDIFGHQVGDRLLQEVAKILKIATRKEDIAAGWGGDEFVVLLPNTSKKEAYRITDRMKELSKKQTVELIPVSVAMGVATKESADQDVKQIFKEAEDRMYQSKADIKEDKNNALLQRFTTIFFGAEFQDMQHTTTMQQNGKQIGTALNLDEEEQQKLDLLIKYHDIGKIAVPKKVLEKEAPLTDAEWEQFKNHVEIGYRIAKNIPGINPLAEEILHHHEHYDGKGFPGKLQGEKIPYLARIMAILDFYDGLSSSMFYPVNKEEYFKEPVSKEEAIAELQKRSGTFFCPELVKIFTEKIAA